MRELEYENNTIFPRAGKNSIQLPAYFVIGDQIYYFLLEFVNKGNWADFYLLIPLIQLLVRKPVSEKKLFHIITT